MRARSASLLWRSHCACSRGRRWPAGEPGEIGFVPGLCLLLAAEELPGLGEDERVGAALPPGQVARRLMVCVKARCRMVQPIALVAR
jgi:hypothetical protein